MKFIWGLLVKEAEQLARFQVQEAWGVGGGFAECRLGFVPYNKECFLEI